MLMEFISVFAAGFVGAGVALLLRLATKGALPRAAVPVFAGLAMIGLTIWSEYSWFGRTSGALPEQIVVVRAEPEPSSWRPWTWAHPYVSRFMAVDRSSIRTNDKVPEQRMAEILVFARREAPAKLPMLIDCQAGRRADIVDGASFDAEGRVTNADWRDLVAGDPLLDAICS